MFGTTCTPGGGFRVLLIRSTGISHRLISSSITAYGKSREWCMSGYLFLFYCLLYKRLCALAHGLVQYFAFAHHRQEHIKLYGDRLHHCDSPFIWLSPVR
ncbi:hypothetical protein HanPI659440_Chr16g0641541 [Helianthus annuus]|nr:hypothetical protein HanPI659440_Chr16g0641541 [Helianthus annuus]